MFDVENMTDDELALVLGRKESHYLDFKSKGISGKDLQRHLVGFANADGGELYVGVDEGAVFSADGFVNQEDANQLVQSAILELSPSVEGLGIDFLQTSKGLLVRFVIPKSPNVHYTSAGDCYVRLSAQTQKIKADDVVKLAYSKGFYKYEEQPVDAARIEDILEAGFLGDYLLRICSNQEPERFLRRNRLALPDGRVNVGCVLLFDECPDEVLSSKVSAKILRMKTSSDQYKREQLHSHEAVSGPLEKLVYEVEEKILQLMKDASFEVDGIKFDFSYPVEAVHEVLVKETLIFPATSKAIPALVPCCDNRASA